MALNKKETLAQVRKWLREDEEQRKKAAENRKYADKARVHKKIYDGPDFIYNCGIEIMNDLSEVGIYRMCWDVAYLRVLDKPLYDELKKLCSKFKQDLLHLQNNCVRQETTLQQFVDIEKAREQSDYDKYSDDDN